MDPHDFRGFGQRAIERVTTNSAVNPLLWLCAATLPFLIPGAIWAPPPANQVCLGLAALAVVSPIVAYFIFLFKDPNRLQSEQYQLEQHRIHLLGDERLRNQDTKVIDGSFSANTAQPALSQINE